MGIGADAHLALQGRRGGEALIALAIAGSLVAGFPEVAFVDGLLGLGWAVMRLCSLPRAIRWLFARRVAVGGVAGLALSAPAVLPFLISLPVSSLGPHGISVDAHLGLAHAATLLFPYVFGPILSDLDLPFWANAAAIWGQQRHCSRFARSSGRAWFQGRCDFSWVRGWSLCWPPCFTCRSPRSSCGPYQRVQLVFLCRYGFRR